MSQRPFNTLGDYNIPGKLVSKDDPEKRGRYKIRLLNQLESNIPDDQLPWSVPEGQTTGGIGLFNAGMHVVGQWFECQTKEDGQSVTVNKVISSAGQKDQ